MIEKTKIVRWCKNLEIEKCLLCKERCGLFSDIEKTMMHIWYEEDAVEYDMPTEEIISQLIAENEMLYRIINALRGIKNNKKSIPTLRT